MRNPQERFLQTAILEALRSPFGGPFRVTRRDWFSTGFDLYSLQLAKLVVGLCQPGRIDLDPPAGTGGDLQPPPSRCSG